MTTHRIKLLAAQLFGTATFLFAAQAPAARGPSLDALVTRAGAYWGLLAKGEKSRALEYVRPQSRDNYLNRQNPAFSEPRVTDLELSQNPAEVWVTVKVKRVLPLIPTPVDWPVKEKWVFEGGKWLAVITISPDKFARVTGPKRGMPAASSEEDEKKRQAIRDALRFDNDQVEFGAVRQGEHIPIELKYSLTGSEAVTWKLAGAPRGLARNVASGRELKPGEGQKIDLSLQTQELEGEIAETFTILAVSAGLEVPYEFSIRGHVYAPLSISPRSLKFLKGETAKEVVLKNNSKSAIQILSAKATDLDVQPLPQTIAPGAEYKVTVRLKLKSYGTNHLAEIALRFAEPVDGVKSATLTVTVNFEPSKAFQRPFWEKELSAPKAPR
jgi:hypothetical protein